MTNETLDPGYYMECTVSQTCLDNLFRQIEIQYGALNKEAKAMMRHVACFTEMVSDSALTSTEIDYLWSCINNPISHLKLQIEIYKRAYKTLNMNGVLDLIREDSGYKRYRIGWLKGDSDAQYVWAKGNLTFLICYLQLRLEENIHYDKVDLQFTPDIVSTMLVSSFDVCSARPSDNALDVSIHDSRELNINTLEYREWLTSMEGVLPDKHTILGRLGPQAFDIVV
ncbi:hypothetical protein VroAM7_50190 (plasmid) [Vibrio rotiferianus]|uniref:Uncharacterized protein n=1 Tax=Vibrio rotiferianus TaxID=190895 RepID=A0A510IIV3_9VIBR|nr:hypothetical protein [Vibrio rotiferianus]BBL92366.1 hypothetical protein VroAM7_50190 [Vibrio rotiferianus]